MPSGLGRIDKDRVTNLTAMLDAFFGSTGYHLNVNVLNRESLLDAMDHPEKYPPSPFACRAAFKTRSPLVVADPEVFAAARFG